MLSNALAHGFGPVCSECRFLLRPWKLTAQAAASRLWHLSVLNTKRICNFWCACVFGLSFLNGRSWTRKPLVSLGGGLTVGLATDAPALWVGRQSHVQGCKQSIILSKMEHNSVDDHVCVPCGGWGLPGKQGQVTALWVYVLGTSFFLSQLLC